MTDTTSIIATLAKTTENYAVYESADVGGTQELTGMYVSLAAFGESPEEFIEVAIGEEGPVALVKNKDTTNYGVYESESGAISGSYFAHDVLGSEETDDGESAPEERGISISPATEEDFEEAQDEMEEEAEALLGEMGDDDAVEVEETSEEDEAEALLEEAEAAAE